MLSRSDWENLLRQQLEEDHAADDVTVRVLGDRASRTVTAKVIAKQSGTLAGAGLFDVLPAFGVEGKSRLADGAAFEAGQMIAQFTGPWGVCLRLERSVLNALTHLCGIATRTRAFVDAVKPHRARILATRKTLPGLRKFQLHAVVCGGGGVHRRSLSDGILLKENHLQFLPERDAIAAAKQTRSPLHGIEVEVQALAALDRFGDEWPDVVMLDNLDDGAMREAILRIRKRSDGRSRIEASGGMTLERVAAVAALGVDYISVGSLTHSAAAIDLSLDFEP